MDALADARENVDLWLAAVALACERERNFLRATGDLADGEISIPYALLEGAIEDLRAAQCAACVPDSGSMQPA